MKSGLTLLLSIKEPPCFANTPSGQASPMGEPLMVVRSCGQIGMSKVCRRSQNVSMSRTKGSLADFNK